MNSMPGAGWIVRMVASSLLCCAPVFCGCSSESTDTDITPTRFYMDRELRNYTSTDEFTWDTTLNQAMATIRIADFMEGDTTLRVYDGRGNLVLESFLSTSDFVYFNGNDLYFQKRTDVGFSGQWRVVVGYNDFTGGITITME